MPGFAEAMREPHPEESYLAVSSPGALQAREFVVATPVEECSGAEVPVECWAEGARVEHPREAAPVE